VFVFLDFFFRSLSLRQYRLLGLLLVPKTLFLSFFKYLSYKISSKFVVFALSILATTTAAGGGLTLGGGLGGLGATPAATTSAGTTGFSLGATPSLGGLGAAGATPSTSSTGLLGASTGFSLGGNLTVFLAIFFYHNITSQPTCSSFFDQTAGSRLLRGRNFICYSSYDMFRCMCVLC
jgi:hypothetical protein